jgi:hypothetical protein
MVVFGGIVGFLVCFFFIACPMAATMGAQTGLALVLPVIGTAVTPIFSIGILAGTAIHIFVVLIFYVLCDIATATPVGTVGQVMLPPGSLNQGGERFCRGTLIGINASANLILLPFAIPWLLSWNLGALAWAISAEFLWQIIALTGCVLNLLALFEQLCANRSFEAALGWSGWVAVMALPANFVGLMFFLINTATGAKLGFEWWTGSVIVHGGLIRGLIGPPTAFSLGNFLFVDARIDNANPILTVAAVPGGGSLPAVLAPTTTGLVFHESGHTLNVSAFGSWFHYIGFIDEEIVQRSPGVYAEILPEGHLRGTGAPWFLLWGPPVGLAGPTPNTPPVLPVATVNGIPSGGGPIVVPSLTPLQLDGGGLPTDPDNYPMGAVAPGVGPSVGVIWCFASGPTGSSAQPLFPNRTQTVAVVDVGGDYLIGYAVSDGCDLAEGTALTLVAALSNQFTVSVVQAVMQIGANRAVNAAIPVDALGSGAGSAGTLSTPGAPPPANALTVMWSADRPEMIFAAPTAAATTMQAAVAGHYEISLTVTTPGGVSDTQTVGIDVS